MWKPSPTPDDVIMHSAKGSTWSKHKYISKKNGKYIYPGDLTNAYKKSQKKASKHDVHVTNNEYDQYEYRVRSQRPDRTDERFGFNKDGQYATHMRSEIEKEDYAAAAASNYQSTTKRKNAAEKYAKIAEDNYADMGISEKTHRNPDAEKWRTVAKSASIREKQQQDYAKKRADEQKRKDELKTLNEANLDRARAKAKSKKIEDVRNASSEIRRKQKYNKAMNEAKKEKTTVMREWKRRNAELDYGKGISRHDRARQHEKKSDRATITYDEGLMRGYDNNKYEKRKGKKVTNPTAKKNQRKAALEKAKYKAKSTLNKVLKKKKK